MREMKWGIIGFGAFADSTMGPAITGTEGHSIGAIVSRGAAKAEGYAEKYRVGARFGFVEEFFAWAGSARRGRPGKTDGSVAGAGEAGRAAVDAVYVVTPNNAHCACTIMAAERGLHVLCEKPMAKDLGEAGRMIEACREAGVTLMIGNMMRFNPCHLWLKKRVDEGALGEILEARATFEYRMPLPSDNWRLDPSVGGGGALVDVGVHCIDLLRYLTGREVEAVSAFSDTGEYPFPADLKTSVLLKLSGGAFGHVYASFRNAAPLNTVELRGTRGSARCEGTLWRKSAGRATLTGAGGTQVFEASPSNPDPYVLQIRHFAECVDTGTTPLVGGEEGYMDLAVCLAAYESAKSGNTVAVAPFAGTIR